MEDILAEIEKSGFQWLIRTDEREGYFININDEENKVSYGTAGIAAKVFTRDKIIGPKGAFEMAKAAKLAREIKAP